VRVGDLVCLSSAGKKLEQNYLWNKNGGYGLLTRIIDAKELKPVYKVRIFGKDGKYWTIQHFYRYEIKKFKKV
tara:strand:- start:393 stop:611 length:219 start_codon:yes stop_codon:yes gene_type:complete